MSKYYDISRASHVPCTRPRTQVNNMWVHFIRSDIIYIQTVPQDRLEEFFIVKWYQGIAAASLARAIYIV